MKLGTLPGAAVLLLIGSLYPGLPASALNIIGKDNRQPMTQTLYPWSAVGRVQTQGGGWCTGTLVWKDLAVTAAHCVLDEKTKTLKKSRVWFLANYRDGKAPAASEAVYAWYGTADPGQERSADWAILKLRQPLGESFGFLGWHALDFADPTAFLGKVTMAGYSADYLGGRTAGVNQGCSVRKEAPSGVLFHDCDMMKGASGGPLMMQGKDPRDWRIIGINVAQFTKDGNPHVGSSYSDQSANLAVKALEFGKRLEMISGANPGQN